MKLHQNDERKLAQLKRYDTEQEALAAAVKQAQKGDEVYAVGQEPKSRGGKYVVVGIAHREVTFGRAEYKEVYDELEVLDRCKTTDTIKEK